MALATVPSPPFQLPTVPTAAGDGLLELWLSGRSPATLDAYRRSVLHFARWLGADSAESGADALLAATPGQANALVLAYRNGLIDAGAASATVNARITALRSLTRAARLIGLISWAIEDPGLPVQRVRDPRGPGWAAVAAMISAAGGDKPRAVRDRAILWLLIGLGLRRAEVASLDLVHFEGDRLWVLGKGRRQRETQTLPASVRQALEAWIAVRGDQPGPLFTNLDRAAKGGRGGDGRLTGRAIHQLVGYWAQRAGVKRPVWPHAIRHSAITAGQELVHDPAKVMRFGRHRSLATTTAYLDAINDDAGKVADAIAARVAAAVA
jgi:integrase/recombinase XerC